MKKGMKFLLIALIPAALFVNSCSDDSNPVDDDKKATVISPNGGEIWNIGGTREIKWTSVFTEEVKLELYKGEELYQTLADTAENTGVYQWVIPEDMTVSADFRIKISSVVNSSYSDMSDEYFSTGSPSVYIYDPPSEITNKEFKVQWYGNSNDSTDMTYYYCYTTDTTVTDTSARTVLNSSLWKATNFNYASVSFPMSAYNSDLLYADSTTYEAKVVYSKFFVYGIDQYGSEGTVRSRVFARSNNKPDYPKVFSDRLGIKGTDLWFTVSGDSAQMIMPEPTDYFKEIDFMWIGSDPDGYDVKLEFKWELWENIIPPVLVDSSDGWSSSNLSVKFLKTLFDHNGNGKYRFKVFVRDDAFEQSESNATVNFEVFSPTFDKGILLLDDTDPSLYPSPTTLINGNPDAALTRDLYETLLGAAGYSPEGSATDSLKLYRIKKFERGTEFAGWDYIWGDDDGDPATPEVILDSTAVYRGVTKPDIKELISYRLVIMASDDRSNTNGIVWNDEIPFQGYYKIIKDYLSAGGKAFVLGPSVLMGKIYEAPDNLPVNRYIAPYRQIFDPDADNVAVISDEVKELFSEYFGIYAMTFPEQKTYFTVNSTSQLCSDHYLADNYDFIGIEKDVSVTDPAFKNSSIDSVKVNDAWIDKQISTRLIKLSLKDNGSVFTGIPAFETSKGERIFKYRSIYDLAHDDSLSYEINGTDTVMTHYLWCKNRVTGEIVQPVLERSGTVASRYAADNDLFKTAFFGFPIYFMDNSENQMTDMFKAMIEWFDLSKDPLAKKK